MFSVFQFYSKNNKFQTQINICFEHTIAKLDKAYFSYRKKQLVELSQIETIGNH